MKVLFDATPMLLESAGVKGHLYEWLRAARQSGSGITYLTWPWIDPKAPLRHDRSMATRRRTTLGIAAFLASHRLRLPSYELLVARPVDLFHLSILQTRLPRRFRATSTIYDCTPLLMPEMHTPENARAFAAHAEQVLRRAVALTAISENSRQDAIRLLRLNPDRVCTIPCVIPARYFEAGQADADAAARQLGLDRPYVLSVGTIEGRKNHMRLLDAWADLPGDYQAQFDLVVAGAPGWHSKDVEARLASGVPRVRWLRYVPEECMPGLTRGCLFLAYPSLYEGFGLPVAQALACKRAVLAGNNSSLPEVAGAGALLVDARSVQEIRDGLRRLLDDEDLRARLAAAGHAHVYGNFTASRIGRLTAEFFQRFG